MADEMTPEMQAAVDELLASKDAQRADPTPENMARYDAAAKHINELRFAANPTGVVMSPDMSVTQEG